jgi:beta-galactosidase
MKRILSSSVGLLIILIFINFSCSTKTETAGIQRTTSFDENWKFSKESVTGAENTVFDDSKWRVLDLPHDWSIEDLPAQIKDSISGPFSKASVGKMGTGFTVGGTAWYRKTFSVDKADANKTAYLQFDGIYMNADIWINGKHLVNHPYGYTSFWCDITSFLNPAGQANIIAVQVKNEGLNARWYSGSGIYRHVWLTLVNPVHIAMWGVSVTTPVATENNAEIEITTTLNNKGTVNEPVRLLIEILDSKGVVVAKQESSSIEISGSINEDRQKISLANPALWSIENPALYQARITVFANRKEVDRLITTFGIRSLVFDAKTGFSLNGKTVKLKGGCFHHDNGPLGAAAIDRAEERKIELLKKAGFNAIRCSHNPPSPYLLDVCDRLGMLVIDEAFDMWEQSKMAMMASFLGPKGAEVTVDDYSKFFKASWRKDIQSMVMRDRNHPSVIMWSIGNEISEAADTSGLRIAKQLVNEVKKNDPSRAVTEAHVDMGASLGGKSTWEERAPHLALLDVIGYNYGFAIYRDDKAKHPERIMYASEFMPPLSLQNWQAVEDLPYVIGNFSWTAMDYLGEAGTGVPRLADIKPKDKSANPMADMMQFFNFNSWPMVVNFQGDLDLIGNPKTAYYYQHVVWREDKISMFVHRPIPDGKKEITSPWGFPDELKSWNWAGNEGKKMQVHVYTRSKLVKLELNGKQVGEQAVEGSKSITATFEVPYEPGTITARCFDNGVETSSETIKTVGKPASVRLSADRSTIKTDRNDLSYVMVEIIDAEGNVVPDADNVQVNFSISGNGELAGVGNGNPIDLSGFQQPRKNSWQGRCLAIIRPKGEAGKIVLTARAEGLTEGTAEILTSDQ